MDKQKYSFLEDKVAIKKVACEACRAKGRDKAGDNKVIYSDGGWWCYVCNKGIVDPNKDKNVNLEVYESTEEESLMEFGTKEWNKLKEKCSKNKSKDLPPSEAPHKGYGFRGISDETYKLFGVINEVLPHEEGETPQIYKQHYPILKEIEGVPQISGVKTREVSNKKFSVKGENKQNTSLLFGQFLAQKSSKKTVVITSGECFTPDMQIMTDRGFVRFFEFDPDNDKILAVSGRDGNSFFSKPASFIKKKYKGEMVRIEDFEIGYELECTPNHDLAFTSTRGEHLLKFKAGETLPVNRYFRSGVQLNVDSLSRVRLKFSDDTLKLMTLICFDMVSRRAYESRIGILSIITKHQRQIEGFKELLPFSGLKYSIEDRKDGKTSIRILMDKHYLDLIYMKFKFPSDWLINSSYEQRKLIIDYYLYLSESEPDNPIIKFHIQRWNDHYDKYFFDYLFGLTGYSYEIDKDDKPYLEVKLSSPLKTTNSLELSKSIFKYNGYVYCVQSPTGFILVRHKGYTMVVGNCDAMASYEMLQGLGNECPVFVSSTVGEAGVGQYKAQYEFFNRFERIVIIPDQDPAGQEALKKAVQALPRGKVHIVDLPMKDPNEMLMKGFQNEFILRYRNAKPFVPDGVVGSRELYDRIIEASHVVNIPIPDFMTGLKELFPVGFALESIMNLVAASGIGKSSFINQIIYYWIFNAPYKVGVLSLELSAGQYGISLLSTHLKVKLNNMTTEERLEYLAQEDVIQKANELFLLEDGSNRFYLIDERSNKLEHVQKMIEQLIIACDCKIIVIDPLQDLFSGASLGEEQEFMAWQKSIIKQYGVLIVNVCHTRKAGSGEKSGSTGGMISEESISGASDVYKSASVNILFTRNKLSDDPIERNRTYCYVSKNRWSSTTGEAGSFYYSSEENWLYDFEEYKKLHPEKFVENLEEGVEIGY